MRARLSKRRALFVIEGHGGCEGFGFSVSGSEECLDNHSPLAQR